VTSSAFASFETERRRLVRRWWLYAGLTALFMLAAILASVEIAEFSFARIIAQLPKAGFFFDSFLPDLEWAKLFADRQTQGSFAYWFYAWDKWIAALWESVQMAILATALGGSLALLASFFAARNLGVNRWLSTGVRRVLEVLRTLPDIVVAIFFVFAFQGGNPAAAGVLAIALHTFGALGKLMAEVHENVDLKPVEGVIASGGSWSQAMRFGVMPQILPNFISYLLIRFEINVASSAAIGLVGAGGIGMQFNAALQNPNMYADAAAIMVMVIALIVVIDLSSEALRHRLMGITK
jgi:phosphonate transport system permease protein